MATNKPSRKTLPQATTRQKTMTMMMAHLKMDLPSNRLEDAKKEIKCLLASFESERKGSERHRELLEGEKGNVKRMKTSIEENDSHYDAKLQKLKGKVEGQAATAKATKAAANDTVRSKVAKAKEILKAKDLRLNDALVHHQTVMKELLSKETNLSKSTDKVLNLERKVSGLNRDLMNLIAEKDARKKQAAAFKSTSEKAKAAVSSQLDAKLAHHKKRWPSSISRRRKFLLLAKKRKRKTKITNTKDLEQKRKSKA